MKGIGSMERGSGPPELSFARRYEKGEAATRDAGRRSVWMRACYQIENPSDCTIPKIGKALPNRRSTLHRGEVTGQTGARNYADTSRDSFYMETVAQRFYVADAAERGAPVGGEDNPSREPRRSETVGPAERGIVWKDADRRAGGERQREGAGGRRGEGGWSRVAGQKKHVNAVFANASVPAAGGRVAVRPQTYRLLFELL
ncbi:hypothetical protein EVAR_5270_1 [Eumeta japonica]|uniref:Uncharacterized protein n=1 Tax=Eumeta variegata TaxID=151549 RepID=A0A4C1TN10_EUMVA|nr:hypothetical protein EVAR_5270_1 [Eumeta japonica]